MPDEEHAPRPSRGEDWRSLLERNPTHQGHPANRVSAKQAIERHAEHRNTSVISAERLSNGIRIRFADGTSALVAFGFVEHSVEGIPGSELLPIGTWNTVLPEHGDFSLKHRQPPIAEAICPNCFITVPVGTACSWCDWHAES